MSSKLKSNMPFYPWIPNNNIIPTVGPSYYKQAQCAVIKDVHTIVVDSGCDATTCQGPFDQSITGIGISVYNCKKWIGSTVIR